MPVLSFVSANVSPERREEVVRSYTDAVAGELGTGVRQTFLLGGEDDTMAIATVWNSREDLDAYIASVEEPLARKMLREAGGEPQATFFDVLVEAQSR
jgi:heme-degrading monooxygenase HmoA